jgi:hypothetical protein
VSNESRINDLTDTQIAVIERWFREKREMSRLARDHGIDEALGLLWSNPDASSAQVRQILHKVADAPLFVQILDVLEYDQNRS